MKRFLVLLSLAAFVVVALGASYVFAQTADECLAAIERTESRLAAVVGNFALIERVMQRLDKAKGFQGQGDYKACLDEATEAAEMTIE